MSETEIKTAEVLQEGDQKIDLDDLMRSMTQKRDSGRSKDGRQNLYP